MNSGRRQRTGATWFEKVLGWELIRDEAWWDDRKREVLDDFQTLNHVQKSRFQLRMVETDLSPYSQPRSRFLFPQFSFVVVCSQNLRASSNRKRSALKQKPKTLSLLSHVRGEIILIVIFVLPLVVPPCNLRSDEKKKLVESQRSRLLSSRKNLKSSIFY